MSQKTPIHDISQYLTCLVTLSCPDTRSQIQSQPAFFRNEREILILSASGILLGDLEPPEIRQDTQNSHADQKEQWVLMGMGALGYLLDLKQRHDDGISLKKNTRIMCHFATESADSNRIIRIPIVELIHVPCERQKKWLRALMGWGEASNDGASHRPPEWHFGWSESQNDLERFGGLVLGRLQVPLGEYCRQMHETVAKNSNVSEPCRQCAVWEHHNWLLHSKTSISWQDPSSQQTSLKHGQSIFVVGSPFGITSPKTFQNSITKGVVSNILGGSEPYIFLTDARMLPGCDGGPVVSTKMHVAIESQCSNSPASLPVLLGICSLPVRNIHEKVEMNVAYAYEPVRREVLSILQERRKVQHTTAPSPQLILHHPYSESAKSDSYFDRLTFKSPQTRPHYQHNFSTDHRMRESIESVVRVQVGNSWASGILLHSSQSNTRHYVLTNAHVFAPFLDANLLKQRKERGVSIRNHHSHIPLSYRILITQHKLDSQYNSSHSFLGDLVAIVDHGPLDLALIRVAVPIEEDFSQGVQINFKQRLQTGEDVFIVGHPLYDPNLNLRPTITHGTLSKVVRFGGIPTLIQTSALVHSGNSGGMVMSKEGHLIGIVTANANLYDPNTKSSKLIPSLNFAVPVSRMKDIQDFVDGKISVHQLDEALNRMDKAVARVWSIQETEEFDHGSVRGTHQQSSNDGDAQSRKKSSALMKYLKEMNQSVPQHMIPKSKL